MANKIAKKNFVINYEWTIDGNKTQGIAQIIARDPAEACRKLGEQFPLDVTVLKVSNGMDYSYDFEDNGEKFGEATNERPFDLKEFCDASADKVQKLFGKNIGDVVDYDKFGQKVLGKKDKNSQWHDAHGDTEATSKTSAW